MTVGGEPLTTKFGGDASGVKQAAAEAIKGIDAVTLKSERLKAALADVNITSRLSAEQLGALKKASTEASAGVEKLATSKSHLKEAADAVDQKLSHAQRAIGGMAQAAGGAGGRVADLVGGVADLAMAFATGGALMAGLAAAGAAIAFMTKKMEESEAAAKKLDEEWQRVIGTAAALGKAQDEKNLGTAFDVTVAKDQAQDPSHASSSSSRLGAERDLVTATIARLDAQRAIAKIEVETAANARLIFKEYDRHTPADLAQAFDEARAATKDHLDLATALLATTSRTERTARDEVGQVKELAKAQREAADAAERYQTALEVKVRKVMRSTDAALGESQTDLLGKELDKEPGPFSPADILGLNEAVGSGVNLGASPDVTIDDVFAQHQKAFFGKRSSAMHAADVFGDSLGAGAGSIAGGFVSGGGMGAMASAAGGALGGVLGGPMGAAIGGPLGSALGGLLDKMPSVMQNFQVLGDAIGTVVEALNPLGRVENVFATAFSHTIETLAPLLGTLVDPLSGVILLMGRFWQALLPALDTILLFTTVVMDGVLGWLMPVIDMLDVNVLQPLESVIATLYNSVIDFYNMVIYTMRRIPGFENFGQTMQSISTSVGDPLDKGVTRDNTDATTKNTAAMEAFNRSMQNLPSGYKLGSVEYASAAPGAPGAGGAGMQMTVNIDRWMSTHSLSDDFQRIQAIARRGVAVPSNSRSASSTGDEHN